MINKFEGEYAFLSNNYRNQLIFNSRRYNDADSAFYGQKYIRTDFATNYVSIMFDIVFAKFSQNEELRQKLLDTGDEQIVYEDTKSTFWGVVDGVGDNYLGKILMNVRFALRMTKLIKLRTYEFECVNEVQEGYWIQGYKKMPDWEEIPYVTCSLCGNVETYIDITRNPDAAPDYCPKCGKYMKETNEVKHGIS